MNFLLLGLFICVLLVLYLLGVPVAYGIGLTGLIVMLSPFVEFNRSLVAQTIVSGADSFVLLAIPLFLLTGLYMNELGITEEIFEFAKAIIGPIRGGIAHVNVIASMLFSGMTGAATADAAGLGVIEYKAMMDENYNKGFSAAVTGASSIIGPIIPPSIPLIVYGVMSETSIGSLFIAGIVPGSLMGLSLLVLCTYYANKHGYDRGDWWNLKRILHSFLEAAPALGAPILIIGGIIGGWFTATEAGGAAMFYTLIVGNLYYDGMGIEQFIQTTYEGIRTAAALLFIIAAASFYAFLVRRVQLPEMLAESVLGFTTEPVLMLLLITAILLLVGLMVEAVAAITILVPVFLPVIQELGIDPIHFGIIMVLTLMVGALTPPFGLVLFILERVTDISLERIMRSMMPFYIPLLLILILVVVFPTVSLWLPEVTGLL